MKVNCIQNSSVSFTAGKINLYSDFDGTYFPEKHSKLYDLPKEDTAKLQDYFKNFKSFLRNTNEDLTFKITTGRTFGEFQTVAELIKSKGIEMPLPEYLITKNGSDEFIKEGSDKEFYRSGKFPYNYSSPNQIKENEIKAETGWTRDLRTKMADLLKKYNFQIIEHDSENSAKDYGDKSIMKHVRYEDFELTDNMKAQSEWKAGIRNDGNLRLYVSFPYDMLNVGERQAAYKDIKDSFEKILKESKVEYIAEEYRDEIGGKRPVLEYAPKTRDGILDKLYDTKKAVQKAVLENDLVVTAGDGENDFKMLNPLNYIDTYDLTPEVKKEISEISEKNIDNILKQPKILERLKKLPFVGILVKQEDSEITRILSKFKDFGKIIEIENGKLQEGIKEAVKSYAKLNEKFAENLSDKMRQELNIIKEQAEKTVETAEKTINAENITQTATETVTVKPSQAAKQAKNGGKIVAISAGITAGIAAIILALRNKGEKSENANNQNK